MLRYPEPLASGALVAVVAPSSPFPRAAFFRGLAWLRGRYRLRVAGSIFSRSGFLAGDDVRRTGELAAVLRDREVRAVVAARGGYGAQRIVDAIDWTHFAAHPKWLVGFSDVTALHAAAWSVGVASVHGPNVTTLARATPWTRFTFLRALEAPRAATAWGNLRVVHPGAAVEGVLVGGNLALLEATAAAGAWVIPHGAVLALEDVTERPYRLDRMLTALLRGGHLARCAAIVLGGFTQCEAGTDGVTADEVLAERLARLGVPVLAGAPFGHGDANDAFVLGARVRVEGATVRWV